MLRFSGYANLIKQQQQEKRLETDMFCQLFVPAFLRGQAAPRLAFISTIDPVETNAPPLAFVRHHTITIYPTHSRFKRQMTDIIKRPNPDEWRERRDLNPRPPA